MLFLILIVDIVVAKPLNETVDADSSNNETLSKSSNITGRWHNWWDGNLRFECPNDQYISRIRSEHDNYREDRRFHYYCEEQPHLSGVISTTCGWTTGYINDFDDPMFYTCNTVGGAAYVTGFESYHNNRMEDRRWNVKCCSGSGTCFTQCRVTGYINDWDRPMDYTVPDGYVITTVKSEHDNRKEDRRWQLQICRLVQC